MICPIKFLLHPRVVETAGDLEGLVSCARTKCVWWAESEGACAMLAIAHSLDELGAVIMRCNKHEDSVE